MIRIKDVVTIFPKSDIQANDYEQGNVPFFTSSQTIKKFCSSAIYPKDSIIMGTGGQASVNFSSIPFSTSTDCFNFQVKNNSLLTKYIFYYLYSKLYEIDIISFRGIGIRHLQKGQILNTHINESLASNKLVNFLDNKVYEINSMIEIENQQIQKLKEYKQAVITETVTKGLDKNVPMKDSGVEWIGKTPENWSINRAKFIAEEFTKGSGITKEDVVIDGDIPCVRYGEIYTKYDNYFNECATRTNLSNVPSPTFIEKGDLLFTCTGELVEEIGKNVLYLGEEKCLAGGDIIVMKHKQHPGFINYAMNCTSSQMQKSYGKAKLKVVHISTLGIGNIYVCLPPYAEQKNISDYLDDFTESINEIILIKQQKICQLDEYKKSLIYEYVTGKKVVQE